MAVEKKMGETFSLYIIGIERGMGGSCMSGAERAFWAFFNGSCWGGLVGVLCWLASYLSTVQNW